MIETKRLSGPVTLTDDGLASGRLRLAGSTFRGASVGLREAFVKHVPSCPWVQAIVAVWGDFPTEPTERENVVYVNGGTLLGWLSSRPSSLDASRRDALADAMQKL